VTPNLFVLTGLALVVIGAVVLAVRVRQQTANAVWRAVDPQKRRAVRRALRTGEADDPEVAEAARAFATATPRQRWAPWLYAGLAAMQALVLTQRIIDREGRAWFSAALLVLFVVMIVVHLWWQRKLDRFRVSAESSSGSHPSS